MKNPKTTAIGVITIVIAVLNYVVGLLNGHPADLASTVATLTAGAGLIAAHDAVPEVKQ